MAVLVEAISVIVRRDAVARSYPGGWDAFVDAVPNATLCADDDLARVGFMHPDDVGAFIGVLTRHGLRFVEDGHAVDIAVADQQRGLTSACDWLEFGKIRLKESPDSVAKENPESRREGPGEQATISACWLVADEQHGYGVHVPSASMELATPAGWRFEGSMSERFGFVPTEEQGGRLKLLRREAGVDVYLNLDTGEEVFVGRSG